MPRICSALLRRAHCVHPLLSLLLPVCRDLTSAHNELRWLRYHALTSTKPPKRRQLLQNLVAQRAKGQPLQYVLGNHPFGDLEILCRPGVLIPRPETECIIYHLSRLLVQGAKDSLTDPSSGPSAANSPNQPPTPQNSLRVLDLCTGTGCIPLLLHSLLSPNPTLHLQIHGIDISSPAISLSTRNLAHNLALRTLSPLARDQLRFSQDDIFKPANRDGWLDKKYDVLVCNPPYISPRGFARTTSKGVRDWEPKLALVPSTALAERVREAAVGARDGENEDEDTKVGDAFYPRLLDMASLVGAKVVLFEVGDLAQAGRVAGMVARRGVWEGWEVWRDWPGGINDEREGEEVMRAGRVDDRVVGRANGRAVVAWRNEGKGMLGKKGRGIE